MVLSLAIRLRVISVLTPYDFHDRRFARNWDGVSALLANWLGPFGNSHLSRGLRPPLFIVYTTQTRKPRCAVHRLDTPQRFAAEYSNTPEMD